MKKITPFLISGVLLLSTVACQNAAKTSADSPNNTAASPSADAPNSTENNAASPDASTMQNTQNDAQDQTRRDQLNSDIRAREQRNDATGGDADRANGDLESEVRSKLEANIPKSLLAIQAEEGAVTVSGTVPNQKDLSKIDTLAKEIKGVQSVTNKATVAPPKQ